MWTSVAGRQGSPGLLGRRQKQMVGAGFSHVSIYPKYGKAERNTISVNSLLKNTGQAGLAKSQ